MFRTTALVFVLGILGSALTRAQSSPAPSQDLTVSVPTSPNATCPIMGKPISTPLYTDTEFGRIYICCKACVKRIQQDPAAAYKAAYPRVKQLGNTRCPVTGKPVDEKSTTIAVQGLEFRLCSKECEATVRTELQATIAKAVDGKLVDAGNKTCPVTGQLASPNAVVRIGDSLVRLSSLACVEEVKKDPQAVLDKVKREKKAAATGQGGAKSGS